MEIDRNFWKDAPVLVTGGAGFIGCHLTKRLVDLGANVVVADNLSRGQIENLGSCIHKDNVSQSGSY